jgi:BirA family transcriptional regulator, biotin operon repressor / biotin---[acetyl-CoA-carboxylase] ligase
LIDLSAQAIMDRLTTVRLGRPALYFAQAGSTNDVVREAALAGAPEGLLAVADEQTRGRGRLGRSWWAPPGSSLMLSLLLRPPLPPEEAGQTTMCLGLGALDGIEAVTGLRAALKWPNDLVLGDRKLAGMLTEMDASTGRLEWVILGLGINVNLDMAAVPDDLRSTAASLSLAVGQQVDRADLLSAILAATEAWYDRLLTGESLHLAWAARLATLERSVRVTLPDGKVLVGRAEGATASGALLVRTPDNQVHTIWAGDIVTLRTPD